MKIDELRVGNHVRMLSGQTAVVLGVLPNKDRPCDDRVEIRYEGSDRKTWAYAHRVVAVVPSADAKQQAPEESEPILPGDRVRHSRKVGSEYRRLGGTVMSVNVTGRSVVVLWDGIGSYREELVSQLEVVHRAEKSEPTPMEQALELLRVEHKATADKIEELLTYRDTLVYAIDTLAGIDA